MRLTQKSIEALSAVNEVANLLGTEEDLDLKTKATEKLTE